MLFDLASPETEFAGDWLARHVQGQELGCENLGWFVSRALVYRDYITAAYKASQTLVGLEQFENIAALLYKRLKIYGQGRGCRWCGVRYFQDKIGSDLRFGI